MRSIDTQNLLVNWVDGMKVNQTHFQQTENAFLELLAANAALSLHQHKYGLVVDDYGKSSFDLSWDSSLSKLSLKRCKAVTQGGWQIDILPAYKVEDIIDLNTDEIKAAQTLYVYLKVNPYDRIAIGNPDPSESRTRPPFVIPTYTLGVMAVKNRMPSSDPFTLIIGKMNKDGDSFDQLDPNYIPPCVSISANDNLLTLFEKMLADLNQIQEASVQIMERIYSKKIQIKDQSVSIPLSRLAEQTASYLNGNLWKFSVESPTQPPVVLMTYLVDFFVSFETTLELIRPEHRQKLLDYFKSWKGITPDEIYQSILRIKRLTLAFSHDDVRETLDELTDFLDRLEDLFQKIKTLNPSFTEITTKPGTIRIESKRKRNNS